jgi:flagellar hook-basal body complex protein FliE
MPVRGPSAAASANVLAMRQAILDKNTALQNLSQDALAPALNRVGGGTGAAPVPAAPNIASPVAFADLLNQGLHQASAMQGDATAQMNAYETGAQTDIAAVMLARQKASVAFEATLGVRNKLLSAYSDIMNMPL